MDLSGTDVVSWHVSEMRAIVRGLEGAAIGSEACKHLKLERMTVQGKCPDEQGGRGE